MPSRPITVAPAAMPSENSGWLKFSIGKYAPLGS